MLRVIAWSRNTGKAKIQKDLLRIAEPTSVLDIGAVGPGPMDLWRSLPLDTMPLQIMAVDQDAAGIERAKALALPVDLQVVSGYDLSKVFPASSFDIAIWTQVLEHVAHPAEFLGEIAKVLKPGGKLWMTLDSGHFDVTSNHRDPFLKRLVRPIIARVSERYWDFGLTEETVRSCLDQAGLDLTDLMHCNLGPLKPLSASLSAEQSQVFVPAWLEFEEALAREGFESRELFRGIYVAAQAR